MRTQPLAACIATAALACGWPLRGDAQASSSWHFAVTLDGSAIGEHRYTVHAEGARREVTSTARYRVKVLGMTVYRYDHEAQERWDGPCLVSLDARTDDDGTRTEVRGSTAGGAFTWQLQPSDAAPAASRTVCPMSFAYWNPSIAARSTLLDPGSGRLEKVQFTPLGTATVDVHGAPTPVRGLRILGLENPIDVWYQGDRWVGLDTRVDGHHLRYRLP